MSDAQGIQPPRKKRSRKVELKLFHLRKEAGKILTPSQAAGLILAQQVGFKVTNVFMRNLAATTRHVVNQGGTGSSKTISLCQLIILTALATTKEIFSIVRKTMPALRVSAMRDFIELLMQYNLYDDAQHDKSNNIYHLNGNEIEFFGLDEPQKVRGRKRSYLWCNEANEFDYEDFKQLQLRTKKRLYLDYNPSEEVHWIYDKILTRNDVTLIDSNFTDNPYLDKDIVAEILRLEAEDTNLWTVFGLGQVGKMKKIIYPVYTLVDDFAAVQYDEVIYGLDFGYSTNPSCLVAIGLKGLDAYIDERIYQRALTNPELAAMMDEQISEQDCEIIADSAEPKSIAEIAQYERSGGGVFNILPCIKGEDSVANGIKTVQKYHLHITKRSSNVLKEISRYAWRTDSSGEIFFDAKGRPSAARFFNHAMDALRYPIQHAEQRVGTSILFEA